VSKISELSDGGSLISSDYLIAVRSGGNVKVRMDQINVDQVDLGDNEFIRLGNSQDLTMVHTSTQSIINQAGIGDLLLQKAGTTKASITANGLEFPDNSKAIFGAGSDLQIYSDGATSYIKESGSSDLKVQADDFYVFNAAGNSVMISALDTGKVGLGFAGVEKFKTSSSGISVTGTVTADGATFSGAVDITANVDDQLTLSRAAGNNRIIKYETAGVSRWAVYADGVAEAGSDAGSDYQISYYNDAGVYQGNALTLTRATGAATFSGTVTADGLTSSGDVTLGNGASLQIDD